MFIKLETDDKGMQIAMSEDAHPLSIMSMLVTAQMELLNKMKQPSKKIVNPTMGEAIGLNKNIN